MLNGGKGGIYSLNKGRKKNSLSKDQVLTEVVLFVRVRVFNCFHACCFVFLVLSHFSFSLLAFYILQFMICMFTL